MEGSCASVAACRSSDVPRANRGCSEGLPGRIVRWRCKLRRRSPPLSFSTTGLQRSPCRILGEIRQQMARGGEMQRDCLMIVTGHWPPVHCNMMTAVQILLLPGQLPLCFAGMNVQVQQKRSESVNLLLLCSMWCRDVLSTLISMWQDRGPSDCTMQTECGLIIFRNMQDHL